MRNEKSIKQEKDNGIDVVTYLIKLVIQIMGSIELNFFFINLYLKKAKKKKTQHCGLIVQRIEPVEESVGI
jgi:hypothetical protein